MTGVAYNQSHAQAPDLLNAGHGEPVRILIPPAAAKPLHPLRAKAEAVIAKLRPYGGALKEKWAPAATKAKNRIIDYGRPRLEERLNILKSRQWQRYALACSAFYIVIGAFAVTTVITAGALLFERDGRHASAAIAHQDNPASPETVASISPWLRLSKPLTLYSIDAPEFAKLPHQHQARRHTTGNGREDMFMVGAFENPQLFYAVKIYRPGGERLAENTLYIDSVRRAAEDGMTVLRMAATEQHRTKFGPASVADIQLQEGQRQRACLTFRLASSNAALMISGLACGADAKPIDRAALTCFIDRISLMASGDDAQVRQVFVEAELSRHAGCTKSSLTAVGRKATWLDVDGTTPAFKTTVAETSEKPAKKSRKKKTAARE